MADHALVLTPSQYRLYRLDRAGATPLAVMGSDLDAHELLGQHLRKGDRLALYTDWVEESYVRSDLPRLWSAQNRQRLLQRRLAQQFPDTGWRAAWSHGGGLLEPPTQATLFSIRQSDWLQTVLDAAEWQGLRVAGLWPISLLLPVLLKGDKAVGRRPVLMSVVGPAGLRHALVMGQGLRFSRLSSLPPGSEPGPWLADAVRTAQYLQSQEWFPRGTELAQRFWLPPETIWPPETVAPALVDAYPGQTLGDDLYARLLRQPPPRVGQVLAPSVTLPWRAWLLGRAAWMGALAVLLASLGWTAKTEWASWNLREQAARDRDAAALARQQRQAVLATAKGDLGKADLAQVTVQAWREGVGQQPAIEPVLARLASVIERFEALQVQGLVWRLAEVTQEGGATVLPDNAFDLCNPPPAADGSAAPAPEPTPEAREAQRQEIRLILDLAFPLAMSLREREATQKAFHEALVALGWQARIARAAVQLGPESARTGTIGTPEPASASFCIQAPGAAPARP